MVNPVLSHTSPFNPKSAKKVIKQHPEADNIEKKPRMRPAHEIYYRVKFDSSLPFQSSDVVIGYEDRFIGIHEIDFDDFEGVKMEVPFHRIRYFKNTSNQVVFWDRRTRVDLITSTYINELASSTQLVEKASSLTIIGTPRHRALSGRQKKKILQTKRLSKRDDIREQLLQEWDSEETLELELASEFHSQLNRISRQQKRISQQKLSYQLRVESDNVSQESWTGSEEEQEFTDFEEEEEEEEEQDLTEFEEEQEK